MVEDLSRFAKALDTVGYKEASVELMQLVNDLRGGGKLPDKVHGVTINVSKKLVPPVEKPTKSFTPQLAEKVGVITGRLEDSYEIINLVRLRPRLIRMMEKRSPGYHLEPVPPQGWQELLQSLQKNERLQLAIAINVSVRRGFYNVGSIRGADIQDLTGKEGLGLVTARFIKTIFEPLTS